MKQKILISIAVSAAEDLERLPGTITAANEMVKWGKAAGYETFLFTDRRENRHDGAVEPLSVSVIKDEISPVLQRNAGNIGHLIVHFAGHGFIKGAGAPILLMSEWASKGNEAINIQLLRVTLQYFHCDAVTIFYDACSGWQNSETENVIGVHLLDRGNELRDRDQNAQIARFNASIEGAFAYMLRGSDTEQPICLFSCALLRAMARDDTNTGSLTFGTLRNFAVSDFKKIAAGYGLDQSASVDQAIFEPNDVYAEFPLDYAPLALPEAKAAIAQFAMEKHVGELETLEEAVEISAKPSLVSKPFEPIPSLPTKEVVMADKVWRSRWLDWEKLSRPVSKWLSLPWRKLGGVEKESGGEPMFDSSWKRLATKEPPKRKQAPKRVRIDNEAGKPRAVAVAKKATAKATPAPVAGPPRLSGPRNGEPDDLQLIRGVGPAIERKLNGLGIFHFDQIANWKTAEVLWVDQQLKFKGRIARDAWIKQSKVLARTGGDQPAQSSSLETKSAPSRGALLSSLADKQPVFAKKRSLIIRATASFGAAEIDQSVLTTRGQRKPISEFVFSTKTGKDSYQTLLTLPSKASVPLHMYKRLGLSLWIDTVRSAKSDAQGALALRYFNSRMSEPKTVESSNLDLLTLMNDDLLTEEQVRDHSILLRKGKHKDPVSGLLASYLSASIGDTDTVRRIAWFYAINDEPIPFDIAMLADLKGEFMGEDMRVDIPAVSAARLLSEQEYIKSDYQRETTTLSQCSVAGAMPVITEGWDLVTFSSLPQRTKLDDLAQHVSRTYVFTAFRPEATPKVDDLIFKGEL